MKKIKVAFICVHNSCRSQMAEALGKRYLSDICECYSAGTEILTEINQDAVRIMQDEYGIDMEREQYPKLIKDIPKADIVVSMGCNVISSYLPGELQLNWGLDDPTGQGDDKFLKVAEMIEDKIMELRKLIVTQCRNE